MGSILFFTSTLLPYNFLEFSVESDAELRLKAMNNATALVDEIPSSPDTDEILLPFRKPDSSESDSLRRDFT